MFADECRAGHNKPRCAEAALLRVVLHKRFLHRIHLLRRTDSFHRCDLAALGLDGEHGAGINRVAIDQDGAGAASAAVADFLAAGEVEPIAQRVEQRNAGLDVNFAPLSIDLER